jgi:hypothetical protein
MRFSFLPHPTVNHQGFLADFRDFGHIGTYFHSLVKTAVFALKGNPCFSELVVAKWERFDWAVVEDRFFWMHGREQAGKGRLEKPAQTLVPNMLISDKRKSCIEWNLDDQLEIETCRSVK